LGAVAASAQDAPAKIVLKVPADAKVAVDGTPTAQTGVERTYSTPALPAGKTFVYNFTVTLADGSTVVRAVEVASGKDVKLDLSTAVAARSSGNPAAAPTAGAPKSREFLFTYKTTVTGLEPGKSARIWLPVAATNEDQQVTLVKQEAPATGQINREPKYGNQIYFVEAMANQDGTVNVALTFRVKRLEVKGDALSKVEQKEIELFLKPDAKVPIGGKPLALVEGRKLPSDQFELGQYFYDLVNDHMMYSKDKPGWGTGDAEWACDSKFGNCTDFHSLFISLARTHKIPAKFEIGFSVPEKRGTGEIAGYHCWAKFKPEGRGWIPVDISDANKVKTTNPGMVKYLFGNLTEDRVTFSVGRDLTLAPKQDGPPVNFLIYPYVEVEGKPYDKEKVKRAFSYQDVN
jgi:uncharacterized protein (TIGR03000 family)